MLLCDSCNGGVHFYCGPAPFHELPAEAHFFQCVYCVRFSGSFHPASNRPPPAASELLQSQISSTILAGYAGSTVASDGAVFAHFRHWHECTYGMDWIKNVDYLNVPGCCRHRSEALSGYLYSLRESTARVKCPSTVYHALKRSFRLVGISTDAFGRDTCADRVLLGLARLYPARRHVAKIGVSDSMLALALADASGTGLDHASLATRVHGLAALFAYCSGGRVSECAASPRTVPPNKHSLKVHMFETPSPGVLEIFPLSTKTTDWRNSTASKRPRVRVWCTRTAAGVDDSLSELALVSFLVGALPEWFQCACLRSGDVAFSFRHHARGRVYHCAVLRDSLSSYTKNLASRASLPIAHFSTKSWKVGRVSHGVLRGASTASLLARGNHATASANVHYRPGADLVGPPLPASAPPGVPHVFALGEARRAGRLDDLGVEA
jgi:hypothetical protein